MVPGWHGEARDVPALEGAGGTAGFGCEGGIPCLFRGVRI